MQLLFIAGGLLLGLVLLIAARTGEGLFKNLQNLLIFDLLVSFELGQIDVGGSKPGDSVLSDSYQFKLVIS